MRFLLITLAVLASVSPRCWAGNPLAARESYGTPGVTSVFLREGAQVDAGTPSGEEATGDYVARSDQLSVMWSPYLFASALEGSSTIDGQKADVDMDFSDLVDVLDVAFASYLEVHKGRWLLVNDISYSKLSGSGSIKRVVARNFGPLNVALNAKAKADVEVEQLIASLALGRRVLEEQWGATPAQNITLDVFAGARYNRVSVDMEIEAAVSASATVGPVTRSRGRTITASISETEEWIHPLLGAGAAVGLTDRAQAKVYGDIAGFDSGRDLTWSASAVLDYQLAKNVSVFAGYKILDMYYKTGDFEHDLQYSGPYLGLTFRF